VKAKRRVVIVMLAVALGLTTLMMYRAHRHPKLYRVVVLPSLGGRFAYPHAMNDRGQVVGYSQTARGEHRPFLWDRERGIEDLEDIDGAQLIGHLNINNAGQIAGTTRAPDGSQQAFIRDPNGTTRLLGSLGSGWSLAVGLNNHGQVSGMSEAAHGSRHAFFWDKTTGMRDVIALPRQSSSVRALNDAGLIWGYADTPTQVRRLFIWHPNEGLIASSELPAPELFFYALNNRSCFLARHRYRLKEADTILWSRQTGPKKLWCFEGDIRPPAVVNDINQVVCWEEIRPRPIKLFGKRLFRNRRGRRRRILWDPDRGRIVLDNQIPRSMRKHFIVHDINNSGVILGQTIKPEKFTRAVLLEPIPEKWGD
jgi:probable HAF family extracellular repeat protein